MIFNKNKSSCSAISYPHFSIPKISKHSILSLKDIANINQRNEFCINVFMLEKIGVVPFNLFKSDYTTRTNLLILPSKAVLEEAGQLFRFI